MVYLHYNRINSTSIPKLLGTRHLKDFNILLDYHSLRSFSNWSDTFGNVHPLKVDIGCGKDDSLIERALLEPQVNFVGIEYERGIAFRLESKVRRSGASNIRILSFEGLFALRTFFEDESVQVFSLHFPDPWPKRRHARRRILSPPFVHCLQDKLVKDGEFFIATDVLAIADLGLSVVEEVGGFLNCAGGKNFEQQKHLPTQTLYEKKFLNQGLPIYYLKFKKNKQVGS